MNSELQSEYYESSKRYIVNDMKSMAQNYLKLGFHLWEVQDMKYYEAGGYENVYDFALEEFGLSKSAVSRSIGICLAFSKDGHSMYLDDKYSEYSYSQLTEMLSMNPEERRIVKKDMTVKQIRMAKQQLKTDRLDVYDYEKQEINPEKTIQGLGIGFYVAAVDVMFKSNAGIREDMEESLKDKAGYGYFIEAMGNVLKKQESAEYEFEHEGKSVKVNISNVTMHLDVDGAEYSAYKGQCWDVYKAMDYCGYFDKHEAEVIEQEYEEVQEERCDVATVETPRKPAIENPEFSEAVKDMVEKQWTKEEENLPGQMFIEDYPEVIPDGYRSNVEQEMQQEECREVEQPFELIPEERNWQQEQYEVNESNFDQMMNNFSKEFKFFESFIKDRVKKRYRIRIETMR